MITDECQQGYSIRLTINNRDNHPLGGDLRNGRTFYLAGTIMRSTLKTQLAITPFVVLLWLPNRKLLQAIVNVTNILVTNLKVQLKAALVSLIF